MNKNSNAAVDCWPAQINLAEKIPDNDEQRSGLRRYGVTNNGKGRYDRINCKDVPQHLVDAALHQQEKVMAAEVVSVGV